MPADPAVTAIPDAPDVIVIGAGVAGLSAGVRLALAGRRVLVVEEAPRLGGRTTAFTDRETGNRVDNGQHVLFGCYRETYEFLRGTGADALVPLDARLSLTMADDQGRWSRLACPSWPPPWHLVGGLLRWRALPLPDRLAALRLAGLLRDVRKDGAASVAARVPASRTVAAWLTANGQTGRIRDWLWDPLAFAALNQSPEVAAAAPFVRVLGELFGPRVEDSAVGLPTAPLDDVFAHPAAKVIEAQGGAVVARTPGRVVIGADGRVAGARVGDTIVNAPVVISAVPWHAFGRVFDAGPPASLAAVAANAAAMRSSPIVTVNLWFDGPVMTERFVGLVGGPMHWAFDKSAIFGDEAGHLSVVASGAVDLAEMGNEEITAAAVAQLRRAMPTLRSRSLRRSVVVREQRATFSLAPGGPPRPAHATPVDGLFLAGDWTDTGLPATIEGAARSGHRAAELAEARLSRP
jgi:hydroxysqualene dehydroxylase